MPISASSQLVDGWPADPLILDPAQVIRWVHLPAGKEPQPGSDGWGDVVAFLADMQGLLAAYLGRPAGEANPDDCPDTRHTRVASLTGHPQVMPYSSIRSSSRTPWGSVAVTARRGVADSSRTFTRA